MPSVHLTLDPKDEEALRIARDRAHEATLVYETLVGLVAERVLRSEAAADVGLQANQQYRVSVQVDRGLLVVELPAVPPQVAP